MSNDIFKQRKAFNFYRSYYETSLLLEKEDRAEFLDSILHYQFTGEIIEPQSPFALLAFRGQIHSLNKQVIGFQKGKETYPNGNPTKGEGKGEHKGSHKEVQEKEEVKEKEKEKEEVEQTNSGKPEKIDFDILLKFLNKKTGRNYRVVTDKIKGKYHSLLKQGYSKTDIGNAITNAVKAQNHIDNGFQYLTLEFFSRPDKIDMYSVKKAPEEVKPKQQRPAGVWDV